MTENPQGITADMEGGSDAAGQAIEQTEARPEIAKDTAEHSPEIEIQGIISELSSIDQQIFAAEQSIAETENKLSALRKEMGMPESTEGSPAADFQNEKIRKLAERRAKLHEQKEEWIKQYGHESLPDGMAMDDGEGGREAKGGSFDDYEDQEKGKLSEEEKTKESELRKQWLEKSKKESVQRFEEILRSDWRTRSAANLDLSVQLMKLRVPKAMDEAFKDFTDGKVNEPPFSTVWIKWQSSSPLDWLLNKPSWISKVEVSFDDEAQTIADGTELKKPEQEGERAEGGESTTAERKAA